MYNISLTYASENKKTGPIPTSVTSSNTCPDSCPLKASKSCYAMYGPLQIHWDKTSNKERGLPVDGFFEKLRKLPRGQLWRHNVAGDLFGKNMEIDSNLLKKLVKENKGKRGFTYTHKPVLEGQADEKVIKNNSEAIRHANDNGFTVNLSADNLEEADEMVDKGVGPVVTILPTTADKRTKTPKGRHVVVCPAVVSDDAACSTCALCQIRDRKFIIGFPAHGTKKKVVDRVFAQKG
jgi:hypothetical protein